jgi:two-component sensor histidine kinase
MTPSSANDAQLSQLRLRALGAVLSNNRLSLFHQTPDHVFDLADNPPDAWRGQTILAMRETDFMDTGLASIFSAATRRCLETQEPQTLEFQLPQGTGQRQFSAQLSPDADGVTTVLSDITEEKNREAAVTSLLREVSHRSKNLLAIVQSVAMQTAHHTEGVREFLDKFRGRLHALSSTQDLVTESEWRGTYLQSLIRSQLSRVGHTAFSNVRISGENPLLGPNASLHIGLAIHELAANATRHGALSADRSGSVVITAELTRELEATKLILQWHEDGLDPAQSRRPPRFGTLVLERIVPLSVGGTAILSIADGTLTYRLDIPADQFEA